MARPLRIEYPNAFYHVMNRGLNRQSIYLIDDDYEIFLEAVKESSKFFGIRIICYCLMPNHYHLLIQTPKANLSRAMRHLNGVYTQRFNRHHKKDGPLFRGRYKAILVQEDEYLTHLIRYIHLNPIQANLTDDLLKYPWTSHKAYLKDKNDASWLDARLGLAFFSNKLNDARRRYREFLKSGIDPWTRSFYSKKKQNPIFGDPDFVERIKDKYILTGRKLSTEIPERRRYHGHSIADRVVKEASRIFKVSIGDLGASKRGQTNYARLAAVDLTREMSGLKLSDIADFFGMGSYKSVSTSCRRAKVRLERERVFKKRYEQVRSACSQEEI